EARAIGHDQRSKDGSFHAGGAHGFEPPEHEEGTGQKKREAKAGCPNSETPNPTYGHVVQRRGVNRERVISETVISRTGFRPFYSHISQRFFNPMGRHSKARAAPWAFELSAFQA